MTRIPTWVFERIQRIDNLVGALLYGSRALGQATHGSDLDLLIVVDDLRVPRAEQWRGSENLEADVHTMALEQWLTLGQRVHWQNFGLSQGKALVDPQGFIRAGLEALQRPPASYRAGGVDALDAYLNSTYRSVKTWRRGDTLGARLHAGVAVTALLDGLFRLAGRWTPYWDRLEGHWVHLAPLGVDVPRLQQQLSAVLSQADPDAQITLYDHVAAWMRRHGHTSMLDAWPPAFHDTLRSNGRADRP